MFRLSSNRAGTLARALNFLSAEFPQSVVAVSFGAEYPAVLIYLSNGKPFAAEFGDIRGAAVFDVLLCQEPSIREITRQPTHKIDVVPSFRGQSVNAILARAKNDVASCTARPFIYGALPIHADAPVASDTFRAGFHLLHDFDQYREFFLTLPELPERIESPLLQCSVIRRAFAARTVRYLTALVPLFCGKEH